ncbi:hypothetical protein DSECCO2_307250 [anaerobic digester metagenome]
MVQSPRLHKTCFSHLVILSVFVSLWQILSSFYPDNGDSKIQKFKDSKTFYQRM